LAVICSPQEAIAQKRNNELAVFETALGKSNIYEDLYGVTAHISSEYKGRTLIELIQNAYDPHPRNGKRGEIAILLDETEGQFGCLYVANRGKGFTRGDFEALCDIARSLKPVNKGIGNKGLGFRSVLQVCDGALLFRDRTPMMRGNEYLILRPFSYLPKHPYLA